jgi:predicted NUDIX family NTP pyrophosphohydrolase
VITSRPDSVTTDDGISRRTGIVAAFIMAGKQSAGLLLYRCHQGVWQVFLVHPGGPYWKAKDSGAWSIPKGEFEPGEDPLAAASREFTEETGLAVSGPFVPLKPVKQPGGKWVHAWAVEGDCDPAAIQSNTFWLFRVSCG